MLNRIVTLICLAMLVAEVLFIIVNFFFKKRKERIAFLRSFKKGKCAIIYLTAVPLYFIGHLYDGTDPLNSFFLAVNKIINLVVLKYETGSISSLMQDNSLYRFTIYFCFVLVGVNALLFTLSLTAQHIWCAVQAIKAFLTIRDRLYIFGNNPESAAIYRSDKKRSKVIIDNISDKDAESMYMDKTSYISTTDPKSHITRLVKRVKRSDRECIFIINTDTDEKNITLCRSVIEVISGSDKKIQSELFRKFKVFVFGDPRYQAIYEDIVSSGFGCIHYVNKYQKIAIDFIDRYPIASFMDERQVDYDSSLIKSDVDINVMLIGFGKTNQQIFLTSVANNQFLTAGEGEPKLKKVKYYIFDKDHSENNKNLNHSYYRYNNECVDFDSEEYLPLPLHPAREKYYRLDINEREFYTRLKKICSKNKNDVNFLVIAFGSDLENLDMAQKLVEKRDEWELNNLYIFVKVRSWHKEQTLLEQSGCYFIGNENDTVYNVETIVGDDIYKMAKMRNEVYDLERKITDNPSITVDDDCIKSNAETSSKDWYMKKSQMERDSSLYGCLSLRSKLNLMGLDYCKVGENKIPALTEKEYLKIYAKDDMPVRDKYSVSANGKPIVYYDLNFADSRRKNMAIHEHQRWNSYMISRGLIPASVKKILTETKINDEGQEVFTNGKNYALRRHGNITTFAGLVKFRRLLAERDKVSEDKRDVIKYDYQLLDDAFWLLSECGYKIIRKQPRKN